jgi:hypothetical protein
MKIQSWLRWKMVRFSDFIIFVDLIALLGRTKLFYPSEESDLGQLLFLGRLLGMCFRIGTKLRIRLAPFVWNYLTGNGISSADAQLVLKEKFPLYCKDISFARSRLQFNVL